MPLNCLTYSTYHSSSETEPLSRERESKADTSMCDVLKDIQSKAGTGSPSHRDKNGECPKRVSTEF